MVGGIQRRRGAQLDEAVRVAIREEVTERGYQGLTFEGVAKRAATSKPVVYRRYSSRAQMVVDAWISSRLTPYVFNPTGSLKSDLHSLVGGLVGQFEEIGYETLRRAIAEADADLLARIREITNSTADRLLGQVIDEAQCRDELGPHPVPRSVSEVLVKLMRHDIVFHGTLAPEAVTEMIDLVYIPLLKISAAGGQSCDE